MKIGIVGNGQIGKSLNKLFANAILYDGPQSVGTQEEINTCDVAFICVPTPMGLNGECDTSIVEEVISWLNVKLIIIRSTVEVGFTERMSSKYQKEIVFQPEFYGSTAGHPYNDERAFKWIVLGGTVTGRSMAINAYKEVISSDVKIYQTDAKTAEMTKYMDNAFLALKVVFCNEMYDMAGAYGINYDELREIWLADPRIGASHTFVYENNRGFGGHCYPKDTQALLIQAKKIGVDLSVLEAAVKKNKIWHTKCN